MKLQFQRNLNHTVNELWCSDELCHFCFGQLAASCWQFIYLIWIWNWIWFDIWVCIINAVPAKTSWNDEPVMASSWPPPMKVSWFQFSHHLLKSFLDLFSGLQFQRNLQSMVDEQWIHFIAFIRFWIHSLDCDSVLRIRRRTETISLGTYQAQTQEGSINASRAVVKLGKGYLRKLASQQACITDHI